MHHIRVLLAALFALSLLPATASADLRSPVMGETSLLSQLPSSRTYRPAIASSGNTTFVVYGEQATGVTVHRITATGTEIGLPKTLQEPSTLATEDAQVAVSGDDVYVAWLQGAASLSERHAVVAASHDGGRTWGRPVLAGRPTGRGAWDLRLAADGDVVFVTYSDQLNRVWTAGSRDGGSTFPCFALVNEPGDEPNGSPYDVAVDGDHVYWTWLDGNVDVMVRRSTDAGRTVEAATQLRDGSLADHPGTPTVAADDGTVAVAFSREHERRREDGSTDFFWQPQVVTSGNGGGSWTHHAIGGDATRCLGDHCSGPYGLDVDDQRVYIGWRARGKMWIAQSTNGGAGFGPAQELGPYSYTWNTSQHPDVSAHDDSVVATWHTAPDPASYDLDPVAAFSSDHGQTFALHTVDSAPGKDLLPVTAAWGPDPRGASFAWWTWGPTWQHDDSQVKFAPMSAATPDVQVIDVRPAQAAQDAARLAAGRKTTIRTLVRSLGAIRTTVKAKVELAYDDENGTRVERTVEEDVVIRPGLNPVQLLAGDPVEVGQGRITAKVTLNPNGSDADAGNNTGEGSRAVVRPRALKVLFVPVAADNETPPSCREVQDLSEGAERFIEASWPVDPERFATVADCATLLRHTAPLTQSTLMGPGELMQRIDRLKYTAGDIDKVIGVVPQGWFARQQIAGFADALGIAPNGGGFDSGLAERQNTGGWVVAHEIAHSYGWTEDETTKHHLNDEPAPGFWQAERRDVAGTTRDFMHFNTNGGDVASPTGRWTSKATWDFLTEELSTGPIEGLAANDALSLTGTVRADGTVSAGPAFVGDGDADPDTTGALTAELLDGNGGVVATRRFGATNELGPIGTATATRDSHIVTDDAAFSLRLPAVDSARTLRIKRGTDVVLTRARSANAPVVQVATPAKVELGADLKITWTASDADGDALTSLVAVSTDGGTTWRSLGDATTTKELTVKATAQLAGDDVRVRVTTTDGWNTTTSTSGAVTVGGQLSDGKIVAASSARGIVTADLDGANLQVIAAGGHEPRWSPDGRRFTWRNGGVHVADADGSDVRKLTTTGVLTPVWMPDGDRIIANASGTTPMIDAETGAALGNFPAPGLVCGFMRDGSRYLGGWNGPPLTFTLYRADGTQGVNYPSTLNGMSCLSFSPDGRSAVTTRHGVGDKLDVVVVDLQTGAARNLTNGAFGGYNADPKWSPTGEWIVWASNKDRAGSTGFGSTDVWKIRPDGTGAVKVLDGKPTNTSYVDPDVQPRRGLAPDPEPTLEERDPVAAAGDASGAEGAEIELDARASKPGAEGSAITAYGWDLDADGTFTDATGATPKATFPDDGSYPVSVLVTDAKGRTATATATVTVGNASPEVFSAKLGDGEPANFNAYLVDAGADELTATVYWNGSAAGETVPLISTADGFRVSASRDGGATSARVVVTDGDGGSDAAEATRVIAPVDAAPTVADATAEVVAGESVDLPLPARDPEDGQLTYEVVDQPAHGTVQLRASSPDPSAPDVTYTAGEATGPVTFTYRVSDGGHTSATATVTVDVKPRPEDVVVPPEPETPATELPRTAREGSKPIDQRQVAEETTSAATAQPTKVDQVVTLPSPRACVSRRAFTIRIKKGDYKQVTVHVNGKRVKVVRSFRTTARVDLRGLPKGRFKVKIAVTLKTGKVIKSTRAYKTCTPGKKKGVRS